MAPEVSVIIPCYNAERWLEATLDSVFAQEGPTFEVILIDDGSTDRSLELAKRHERRGLRVLAQPNRGQCAAANHGFAVSRGRWIKFLDADDLLGPGSLAAQTAALAEQPRAIAHAAWSRFRGSPEEADFSPLPVWRDAAPIYWLVQAWTGGRPMHQCGIFLLPRVLIEERGGWDERLSLINDFEFFARIITASDGIRFTPGARLYYRSGIAGSLSTRRSRAAWESAYLSATLATEHLLAAEDSPRARQAAADCLRELVFNMYPAAPDLVARLEDRVRALRPDAPLAAPAGGACFRLVSSLLGWKTARRLQILLRR